MTVTILFFLALLSRLVPADAADCLGLCDAEGVANGALGAQGVVNGTPPRLDVVPLCWNVNGVQSYLSTPDGNVNLVRLHVQWDVCRADDPVDGCLCLKLSWPGAASQPRPFNTKASSLFLENSQCCPYFRLNVPPRAHFVGDGWQLSLVVCLIGTKAVDGCWDANGTCDSSLPAYGAVIGPCLSSGPACGPANLLNDFRHKAKDPYPRKGISQVGLFVPKNQSGVPKSCLGADQLPYLCDFAAPVPCLVLSFGPRVPVCSARVGGIFKPGLVTIMSDSEEEVVEKATRTLMSLPPSSPR